MSGSGATMDRTRFDRHAKDYTEVLDKSLRPSGYSTAFFAERKVRELVAVLTAAGGLSRVRRILNFGCGTGVGEPFLSAAFPQAEITSIDVSSESLAVAARNAGSLPNVRFQEFDGRTVPFPPGFDVILVAGVLHHVPVAERPAVSAELRRVLADDGTLFLFEHNPWNPFTRRIVRDCVFDDDAVLLSSREAVRLLEAAGFACAVRYIHFFPAALKGLLGLERSLRRLPLGAQYYCICRNRRGQP